MRPPQQQAPPRPSALLPLWPVTHPRPASPERVSAVGGCVSFLSFPPPLLLPSLHHTRHSRTQAPAGLSKGENPGVKSPQKPPKSPPPKPNLSCCEKAPPAPPLALSNSHTDARLFRAPSGDVGPPRPSSKSGAPAAPSFAPSRPSFPLFQAAAFRIRAPSKRALVPPATTQSPPKALLNQALNSTDPSLDRTLPSANASHRARARSAPGPHPSARAGVILANWPLARARARQSAPTSAAGGQGLAAPVFC